jgi:hypothetical protein
MSRATALALACYPPSWKERYGDELADLATDGDAADLLVGAARAWLRPAGAPSVAHRRVRALGTVHVAWCAAFVAAGVFFKAVNDPPVPGLRSRIAQPLWGVVRASLATGFVVITAAGFLLLLRVAVPALRDRQWQVLRPLLPAGTLLIAVTGTTPFVGSRAVLLAWLVLCLALAVAAASGPVLALRRSGLPAQALRWPLVAATAVALAIVMLALSALGCAAALSRQQTAWDLTLMWSAAAVLLVAAVSSGVSVRRGLA